MGSIAKKESFTVVRDLDEIVYFCVMLNCI